MSDEQVVTIERSLTDRSASIAKLASALAKAQGAMEGASKSAVNPHFRSKYADLASVWDACREPLSKHELAVLQPVSADGPRVTITTILAHSSGEWISESLTMTASQNTPQAVGSAITYGRRYGLSAMVGIAPEDDDGNAASQGRNRQVDEEEPAARTPDGYEDWLNDLAAVADEGTVKLQETWKKSRTAYRAYLTSTNPNGWESLKKQAAKADKEQPAGSPA